MIYPAPGIHPDTFYRPFTGLSPAGRCSQREAEITRVERLQKEMASAVREVSPGVAACSRLADRVMRQAVTQAKVVEVEFV